MQILWESVPTAAISDTEEFSDKEQFKKYDGRETSDGKIDAAGSDGSYCYD